MAQLSENDLCPGYRANHCADSGLCCCGLYWEKHMPLHDTEGRVLGEYLMDRWIKRKNEALEQELHQDAMNRQFAQDGLKHPTPFRLFATTRQRERRQE